MPTRNASATWNGNLKEGNGSFKGSSGALQGSYSFGTRFENNPGTNPEELIGAAHAACFSMALAAGLGKNGMTPQRVSTTAAVTLEKVGEAFKITDNWYLTSIQAGFEPWQGGVGLAVKTFNATVELKKPDKQSHEGKPTSPASESQ